MTGLVMTPICKAVHNENYEVKINFWSLNFHLCNNVLLSLVFSIIKNSNSNDNKNGDSLYNK